mmetsp:Transcript_1879/g.3131  ORF Transcript_1879/g.3131 Transcript_1879/m.3131 type:complete len:212 (-) Transcript_1879:183-818(-)
MHHKFILLLVLNESWVCWRRHHNLDSIIPSTRVFHNRCGSNGDIRLLVGTRLPVVAPVCAGIGARGCGELFSRLLALGKVTIAANSEAKNDDAHGNADDSACAKIACCSKASRAGALVRGNRLSDFTTGTLMVFLPFHFSVVPQIAREVRNASALRRNNASISRGSSRRTSAACGLLSSAEVPQRIQLAFRKVDGGTSCSGKQHKPVQHGR